MKKFILSAIVIVSFISYALYIQKKGVTQAPVIASTTIGKSQAYISPSTAITQIPPTAPVSPAISQTQPTATSQPVTPTAVPQSGSQYKDGQYTGPAADAFYGNIQVRVTISGGKITNIVFLQHPDYNSYSIYVNSQADPMLAQEAIQAQSANVNAVSGATESSQAFVQSLSSALQQAKS